MGAVKPLEAPLLVASPRAGARWLAAHMPAFELERCGFGADERAVVVAERQSAVRVVALTPAARAEGLREGMTVAEARALVADVLIEHHDPEEEARDREALRRALGVLGDRVQILDGGEVVLEIRGLVGLYGGEQGVLRRVRARAEQLGHRVWLAVADHPRAAAALAGLDAGDVLVPPGDGARALARVPIEALRPSPALREAWLAVGVRTIGELARLDPAAVADRYAAEGAELHRVARGEASADWAWGQAESALVPVVMAFEEAEATTIGLSAQLEVGLLRLRSLLIQRARGVIDLDLRLDLDGEGPVHVPLVLARPSADVAHLLKLLRLRLERLVLPAPVVGLVLRVLQDGALSGEAGGLFDRREVHEALPELVTRLEEALGEGTVFRAQPVESWRAEAAWRAVPTIGPWVTEPEVLDDPVAWQEASAWRAPCPRPVTLRVPACPVRVEVVRGRPACVWVDRVPMPVGRAVGPERLAGAWWEDDGGQDREAWVVGLPDGDAWIYEERGRWYVAGWFG